MTVEQFFQESINDVTLSLGDDERNLIENKHVALRSKLRELLPLKNDFLTGSYKRETILKPKDSSEKFDVDIFVAFGNDEYGEAELSELRDKVISALRHIQKNDTEIGIKELNTEQRRSVGVGFGGNFQIDIVPAIEIEKDIRYKIFDKDTLEAVRSNPIMHGDILTEANKTTGGKLVPLVRLLKSWKRNKAERMKSFHLELLATEILGKSEVESYAEGVDKFFASARERLKQPSLYDPANEENLVDEYLDEDNIRSSLVSLVEQESRLANEALRLERSGDAKAAIETWKKIFDDFSQEKEVNVRIPGSPPRPHGYGKKSNSPF